MSKDICKLNWPTTVNYDDEDYLIDFIECLFVSGNQKDFVVSFALVLVDYFPRFVNA